MAEIRQTGCSMSSASVAPHWQSSLAEQIAEDKALTP
jgi:hypothetical protein